MVVASLVILVAACSVGGASTGLRGTAWTVTSIGTRGVSAPQPTMVFGTDGTISGTTGCNEYTGTFEEGGSTLTIRLLSSTARACADPAGARQEADLAVALGGAASWAIRPDGDLEIKASSGIGGTSGTGDIVAVHVLPAN
jgi:heat shock protein HslJ